MRIGLLTDGYKPGVNGVIRFISLHKRYLEKLGHEVFVFTWGRQVADDEPGVIRSAGLPFVQPGYHVGPGHSRRAHEVLATLDLLHANQPLLSGVLAVRYGRMYQIPIVLSCHSRYDLLAVTRLPFLPLPVCRATLRLMLRWLTERYDLTTAPSAGTVDVLRGLGVNRPIEVVPFGVERPHRPGRRLSRDDLGLGSEVPVAVFVGRMAREKNVGFLLQCLAEPTLAHAHLLLVGDGSERDDLEAAAQALGVAQRAHFVGAVPPADVPAYLSLADFFVTASEVEMLPVALLEGLAAGLPVVGRDVPWIRDPIEHGVSGLLTDPGVEPYARAWARLLNDEPLRARLSAGARTAGARYDIEHTTALMAAHYERLLQARRHMQTK
jgi:1,2-diacylglycerol 3-alpha-glucosyltransferase